MPAELLELLGDREALHSLLHEQEGDAVMATLLGGLDRGDHEVGPHAVGDEGLGAVDHVPAVLPAGERADAGHVRAGARLADPQGADALPAYRRGQEALLLVLGAELPDRRRGDRDMCADARGQAPGAAARELLGEHGVVHVVAPLPAVLLRVLQAEKAELGHPGEDLAGKPARVLPFLRVGTQLGGHEAPHRLPQLLMLLAERGDRPAGGGVGQALLAEGAHPMPPPPLS